MAVQVTDSGGLSSTDTATVTVNNVAPTITAVAANQTVNEGQLLSITDIITFSDPGFGAGETFTFSIDWGDGTAPSTGSATIDTPGGPVVQRQIVGILARRIVCRVSVGDRVAAGQRYGVMKFGSRMDVFLPPDATITARVGDRVTGAVTVLAELPR